MQRLLVLEESDIRRAKEKMQEYQSKALLTRDAGDHSLSQVYHHKANGMREAMQLLGIMRDTYTEKKGQPRG